eukprot:jgi/Mesen1/6379/ME000329S05544
MARVYDVTCLKPNCDKRLYRSLKLANQLEVLLISDDETDKAAAAMSVNVGNFSDPEDLPGLAHFLEHMLFYSSEKYPVEDSYSKFLAEHGGQSNAYTATEHTNYQLDVSHEHLEEALDRFAQFFICPLLSADATSREMKAVDSENSKNLTSDTWRLFQLHKSLTSVEHPYHKYGTGNLETLSVVSAGKGVDTRDALLQLYHSMYSANLMRLVVYGRNSLDELQSMVEGRFSAIVDKGVAPPRFPGHPCAQQHRQVVVKAVPVAEGHTLELHWPVPPELRAYRAAPSRYLGHLLGHEGAGSLFALLKSRGWATGLSAGENDSSHDYAFFLVSVELTDVGQDHVAEILGLVLQYIEVAAVCETKFNFQEKRAPFSYVRGLAANMLLYPVEDWLAGSSLPRTFDAPAIMDTLAELTASNLRVVWVSKQFEAEAVETEPWYGTRYCAAPLPSAWLQMWEEAQPCAELHLPPPNEFIPTDFSLRELPPSAVDVPEVVAEGPLGRVWWKGDTRGFRTPKAVLLLDLLSPAAYSTPEAAVLTRLFAKLLRDDLNEFAYLAEVAGLSYNVDATVLGLQISVSGYSHKLAVLAHKIMAKLLSLDVSQERFDVIKAKTLKDFLNFQYEQPYQQALYDASVLLQHRRWHMHEYIQLLPAVQLATLKAFIPQLLSRVFIECYAAGNMGRAEAEGFLEGVQRSMGPRSPLFASQLPERRVVQLQPGASLFHPIAGLNPADDNSALLYYLQAPAGGAADSSVVGRGGEGRGGKQVGADEVRTNVLGQLLVQAAKRQVFHQLRSVQQLGYIVFLLTRNDAGVHGIHIIIQSTVMGPDALEARVEAFWDLFAADLAAMTAADFETHKEALTALKLEKHKNLSEETSAFWPEIDDGTLLFKRAEIEAGALKEVGLEDLRSFFSQRVKSGGPLRRKLSVHVIGARHQEPDNAHRQLSSADSTAESDPSEDAGSAKEEVESASRSGGPVSAAAGGERITDAYAFKCAQSLYGSFRGRDLHRSLEAKL